mmetsp:Transcript_5814/g.16903  ORF Transcript_5814/g.16903 Transcript_5814/m.16903 type:complete len:160 (-) Transcript_5814:1292-1771(-)
MPTSIADEQEVCGWGRKRAPYYYRHNKAQTNVHEERNVSTDNTRTYVCTHPHTHGEVAHPSTPTPPWAGFRSAYAAREAVAVPHGCVCVEASEVAAEVAESATGDISPLSTSMDSLCNPQSVLARRPEGAGATLVRRELAAGFSSRGSSAPKCGRRHGS